MSDTRMEPTDYNISAYAIHDPTTGVRKGYRAEVKARYRSDPAVRCRCEPLHATEQDALRCAEELRRQMPRLESVTYSRPRW